MAIKFTDLHDKLVQCNTGLISKEQLTSWLDENVKVKKYISLSTKYAIISVFVNNINTIVDDINIEEDLDYLYMTYDINLMFGLLFQYIDIPVISKYRSIENYDLVMESGLYDYLMDKCEKDYRVMVEKCDRLTGINNLSITRELSNIFGNPPSVEDIERIKDLINNEIDVEKLNIIKAIEEYNNPTLKKIIDRAERESVREIIS